MNSAGVIQKFEYAARFNIEAFHSIPSTNPYLFDLGKKGAPEWTVIAADRQTAGKGRYQRRWESPAGKSLLFSMLLRPQIDTRFLNLINLLVALTLSEYLEKQAGEFDKSDFDVSLKWPNDLWVKKKKLCGVLLEANFTMEKLNFIVIGIGLNVNQESNDFSPEIRNNATSLFLETGREWDRESLLAGYLDYFYEHYCRYFPHDFREIVDQYQQKVIFKGEWITVGAGDTKVSGFFKGMTPEGYLILDQKGQEKIITTGDVFAFMNK
jgi:BirA family biotin operon repressor/biotin-[acetyl-CoA-carboxylase] ligase